MHLFYIEKQGMAMRSEEEGGLDRWPLFYEIGYPFFRVPVKIAFLSTFQVGLSCKLPIIFADNAAS